MVQLKLKALTYFGKFIDANLLQKGVYESDTPFIYNHGESIDTLIEKAKTIKDMSGGYIVSDDYISNLGMCELTTFTLIDKPTINVLEKALQCYFADANQNLKRKDLGDLEEKNYQWSLSKSKEVMNGLNLL